MLIRQIRSSIFSPALTRYVFLRGVNSFCVRNPRHINPLVEFVTVRNIKYHGPELPKAWKYGEGLTVENEGFWNFIKSQRSKAVRDRPVIDLLWFHEALPGISLFFTWVTFGIWSWNLIGRAQRSMIGDYNWITISSHWVLIPVALSRIGFRQISRSTTKIRAKFKPLRLSDSWLYLERSHIWPEVIEGLDAVRTYVMFPSSLHVVLGILRLPHTIRQEQAGGAVHKSMKLYVPVILSFSLAVRYCLQNLSFRSLSLWEELLYLPGGNHSLHDLVWDLKIFLCATRPPSSHLHSYQFSPW